MLSIDDLAFFAVISASPTLQAAARALDVTSSAVSQRLSQIEARLGVQLVQRSGGHMALTDEGTLLLERGGQILTDMRGVVEELRARGKVVRGHLAIAAPFGFGRHYVAPAIAAFREEYPESTVNLTLLESPAKSQADSFDVVLHIGTLSNSSRVMVPIAQNARILCASPEFMAGRTISKPEDLAHHPCLALRENEEDVTLWRFSRVDGAPVTVRIQPALSTNDGEVLRDWTLSGIGLSIRSEWDIASDLWAGRLVRVLPEWSLPDADVVALLDQRRGRTERSRRFVNMLRVRLSPCPWRLPRTGETQA